MVTFCLETTIVSDHFPLGYEPHSPALSISFQKLALLHLAKEGVYPAKQEHRVSIVCVA
jgi:hypothetical protein